MALPRTHARMGAPGFPGTSLPHVEGPSGLPGLDGQVRVQEKRSRNGVRHRQALSGRCSQVSSVLEAGQSLTHSGMITNFTRFSCSGADG